MKAKKQISIMMMFLIVLLPIAIAQAASDLELIQWSGEDNVNGFVRPIDTLTVKARAMISGESVILPQQVNLWIGNLFNPFTTCRNDGEGYFNCTYTTNRVPYTNKIDFKVILEDDDGVKRKEVAETIIVDSYNPKMISFEVEPEMTTGPVKLIYEAEDYGTTNNVAQDCAGIKEVIFLVNGEEVLTDYEEDSGVCEKSGEIVYDYDGDETKVSVCAMARDFLGKESVNIICDDLIIDEGPPTIKEIAIVNDEGAKVTHVKSDLAMPVKVRAEITDESGINASTVKADLTDLDKGASAGVDEIKDDYYYWKNMEVSLGSEGTIEVTAYDNVGLFTTQSLSFDIKTDNVGPEKIQALAKAQDDEGNPLLNQDSVLVIRFVDKDDDENAGIGMTLAKAYLDLSSLLGDGFSNKQAEECNQISDDEWECKWRINPHHSTTGGMHEFTLLPSTQDDLGNRMTGDKTVIVSYQPGGPLEPTVIEYKVIPGPIGIGGEAVHEDTVHFKVRSQNFEKAVADFSDIGGDSEKQAVRCYLEQATGADICEFEEVVQISGPADALINFTFVDVFNDESTVEYPIKIYDIDTDTTRSYWSVKNVECSPQPIDRKTTSLIPQTIACHIELRTLSHKKTVSIIGPGSIYDCSGNTTNFIDDIRTINTFAESKDPYFMIQLPARDYYLDNLSFSCPITIYSKDDTTIYAQPEKEDVDINLKFYDLPLGEFYANREKDVKNAVDSARGLKSDTLAFLVDAVNIAEELCNWKNAIVSLIASLQGILTILEVKEDAWLTVPIIGGAASQAVYLVRAPFCEGAVEGTERLYKGMEEDSVYTLLDTACAVVNCQLSGGKQGWGIEGLVGGAAPWCTAYEDFLTGGAVLGPIAKGYSTMQAHGQDVGEPAKNMRYFSNIKDNIYLSFACLCLPGIIRNINKLAQIKCKYATCLEKDYKEKGLPASHCEHMADYLRCTYVWGGGFFDAIVPFSQFFESISQWLGNLFASWESALVTVTATGWGLVCDHLCEAKPAALHKVCAVTRVIAEVGEAVNSIAAMTKTQNEMGMVTNEWCEEMEEWADDFEEGYQAATVGGAEEYEPF